MLKFYDSSFEKLITQSNSVIKMDMDGNLYIIHKDDNELFDIMCDNMYKQDDDFEAMAKFFGAFHLLGINIKSFLNTLPV